MEIQVVVTAQISLDDDAFEAFPPTHPMVQRARDSVVEAVHNALSLSEDAGFCHDLAATGSIGIVAVELLPERNVAD